MGHGGHWRQSLPSARRQALDKDFLFFIFIFFAEGEARPSAKIFFWFFEPSFFVVL